MSPLAWNRPYALFLGIFIFIDISLWLKHEETFHNTCINKTKWKRIQGSRSPVKQTCFFLHHWQVASEIKME